MTDKTLKKIWLKKEDMTRLLKLQEILGLSTQTETIRYSISQALRGVEQNES